MEYGSNFELSYTIGKGTGVELTDSDNRLYLRSAREALFLIAQKEKKLGCTTVYMPALCCSSMVQPFIQLGYEVVYYRLTEQFTVDYVHLHSVLGDNALLLVMHYYGIKGFDLEMIEGIVGERNIRIIQDCTQHIFSNALYADVDYRIGSLRKWISIPDGATLVGRTVLDMGTQLLEETRDVFVTESYQAMKEKSEYLITGKLSLKESYRKRNAFCMEYLKRNVIPHKMSKKSRVIYQNDILVDEVIRKRHENYEELRNEMTNNKAILEYAVDQHCPLCLPILTLSRDLVQEELARAGVYCQVLWPIPTQAKSVCKFSTWFSDHMLAVPCDQRYSVEDMHRIAVALDRALSVCSVL